MEKMHESIEKEDLSSGDNILKIESDIEIRSLNFHYDRTPVFKKLTQTIQSKKINLIFGPSGKWKIDIDRVNYKTY